MNQRIDGDDTSGPVAASDVSAIPTPPLLGTNVQDQLGEIAAFLPPQRSAVHYFFAGGGTTFVFNNQPAGLNFWGGTNGRRATGFVDLTGFTEYRIDAFIATGSSVGTAFVGYRTDLPKGSVIGTGAPDLAGWINMGTNLVLSVNRIQGNNTWQPLPPALVADPNNFQTALALLSIAGDGIQDPAFGNISIHFR